MVKEVTTVMLKPSVIIPMAVLPVTVNLDTLVMVLTVKVREFVNISKS